MKAFAFFVFAGCCLASINVSAQTPKQIEADLLRSFKQINNWSSDTGSSANESLWRAKKIVGEKLVFYTNKFPSTISFPFNLLKKEHVNISTSDDGLFRIYSWDTWTGGTMHFFESVFQYKVKNRTFAILDTEKYEGDVRPDYNKLYTLETNGKAYYLTINIDIGSTKDYGGSVQIFSIEDTKLNDSVKLIKTQSGLHSNLSYYYDLSKSSDKRTPSGYPTIHYDAATKTLFIPLVEANGAATKSFILYKFTGKYFEKVKD